MKTKRSKLKFKPTPISRLFKYNVPLKMVGDPNWYSGNIIRHAWANREKAVYAHMMAMKSWPMPWSPETYEQAWQDNWLLDHHLKTKWNDYPEAMEYKKFYDNEEAIKDNAACDYHHENFIAA